MRATRFLCAAALVSVSCSTSKESTRGPEATEPSVSAQTPPTALALDAATASSAGDLGYGDDARLFDSAADAVTAILADEPKIIGFGEFHQLEGSPQVRSALRRFADEIFDVLAPHTSHLVLETWNVDPKCGAAGKKVERQVQATIQRPPETESEMQTLMRKAQKYGVRGHVLSFDCDEYKQLLGKEGLDYDKLLAALSRKLGDAGVMAAEATANDDTMTVLYGGSTHNDLSPYEGLEGWSYAKRVDEASGGRFVEVDLYVPELVQDSPLLQKEAWFVLMKEARKDKVILIRRDRHSYILLLRKGLAPVAPAAAPAP